MRPSSALGWMALIALLVLCACEKSHTFADGHTIEIARDDNFWFRWIMLGVCALLALVMIGIAVGGQGWRIGVYAIPFAVAPVLLYPGTTKPSTASQKEIAAYQAKLDAAGGISWKVVAEDAPKLIESLEKRVVVDIKTFADTVAPKLAEARKQLEPRLRELEKAGVVTHADLVKRADAGDAKAKEAMAELARAARYARAAGESQKLRAEMEASAKLLTEMKQLAASDKPPHGADARKYAAGLERARELRRAKLPKLDADPGEYTRKVFESIVGPPPAELPQSVD